MAKFKMRTTLKEWSLDTLESVVGVVVLPFEKLGEKGSKMFWYARESQLREMVESCVECAVLQYTPGFGHKTAQLGLKIKVSGEWNYSARERTPDRVMYCPEHKPLVAKYYRATRQY